MNTGNSRPYRLAKKLSDLFVLDCNKDTVLSASMYYLNEFMRSERTSIFAYQPWNQELGVLSSLDLTKHEISIPKSFGISGWVFRNRKPAVVDNVSKDSRFYDKIDEMTGFYTTNMICVPIIDPNNQCVGTLQTCNKKAAYTYDDLELMDLAAHMVAISIGNSHRHNEMINKIVFQKKIINRFVDTANSSNPTYSIW